MNLKTVQKEKDLFGEKIQRLYLELMLYSAMKLYFLILEKSRKKWVKKGEVNKSSKTGKGKHKVNAWAAISRNGRSDIELFTNNMDSDFYWEVLKRNIKSLEKIGGTILFYNETMLHLMLAQKL